MNWQTVIDIALSIFLFACIGGAVVLNLFAMFGDYFVRKDK